MNLDFWDLTQLNILLTVRDYYQEKAVKEQQEKDYEKKVKIQIAEEAVQLGELAMSVFEKANPFEMPKEAGEGLMLLPFFCFSKTLQVQRGPVTRAQREVLELFTRTLEVGFNPSTFLTDNKVSQKIYRSVGITMDYMGTFWESFFKCVYVTEESPEILEKLAQCMTDVVLRFAVLGKANLNEALSLCESFLQALTAQAIKAYELSESKIDYFGEASYIEHKHRAEGMAQKLVHDAGDEDKLDIRTMLPAYFVGLLYDLIDRAKGTNSEKQEMLQFALQRCQIEAFFVGEDFFSKMKQNDPKYAAARNIMEQFLPALSVASVRADQMDGVIDFTRESTNLMIGIEKELATRYPRAGFGTIASPMMCEKIENVLEYIGN